MAPSPPSLTLVRRIKAPPARVFDAFVRPDMIVQWWGPDRGPTTSAEVDARPGGGYRVCFRTEDGQTHEVTGSYRTIQPPDLLVYTMRWATTPERESLVTIRIGGTAEGSELTLLHEQFHDDAVRDAHREGWGGALDKLQAAVEAAAREVA